jgi:serine/threonine protein kinase
MGCGPSICALPITLTTCGTFGCIVDNAEKVNTKEVLNSVFLNNIVTIYDVHGKNHTLDEAKTRELIDFLSKNQPSYKIIYSPEYSLSEIELFEVFKKEIDGINLIYNCLEKFQNENKKDDSKQYLQNNTLIKILEFLQHKITGISVLYNGGFFKIKIEDKIVTLNKLFLIPQIYCKNCELSNFFVSEFPKPFEQRLNIIEGIKPIFEMLKFLHQNKIYHRDIKIDNLLWDGTNMKLIDFGMTCQVLGDEIFDVKNMSDLGGTLAYYNPQYWLIWCNIVNNELSEKGWVLDITNLEIPNITYTQFYNNLSSFLRKLRLHDDNFQSTFLKDVPVNRFKSSGPNINSDSLKYADYYALHICIDVLIQELSQDSQKFRQVHALNKSVANIFLLQPQLQSNGGKPPKTTVKALKQQAKSLGLTGYSKLNKADLIKVISEKVKKEKKSHRNASPKVQHISPVQEKRTRNRKHGERANSRQ